MTLVQRSVTLQPPQILLAAPYLASFFHHLFLFQSYWLAFVAFRAAAAAALLRGAKHNAAVCISPLLCVYKNGDFTACSGASVSFRSFLVAASMSDSFSEVTMNVSSM